MYQSFMCVGDTMSAAGQRPERYAFDSRAQRKVTEDQDLAVVVVNANGVAGLIFVLNFRILIKLH